MSTHSAVNQLDGFTFGDGTYYVDLTQVLGNRTVASATLASQSNEDEAEDLTVGTPSVLGSSQAIYDGATQIGTIATGKGFAVDISGGGTALYTLVFSFTDSAGNVDGIEVQLNVQ
jgi:hypothetical protein